MEKYALTHCRICNSDKLYNFLDLGSMPLPNGFLRKEELGGHEPRYALGTTVCQSCWLVQLTRVVPPEFMFSNYLYIPSTSSTMLEHFKSMAHSLITRFQLSHSDLVMDIGSNDGTLLNFFRQKGLPVLGIDPASNLAHLARMKGVNTIDALFCSSLSTELVRQNVRPKLITATNVVAHIHNVHDLCNGVSYLLSDEGVFVVEFPYLLDLLEKNEFDTIYHEHLSYFSLYPLVRLFEMRGMEIFDFVKLPVHGGSMRIFVAKKGSKHTVSPELQECLQNELNQKINSKSIYDDFSNRVQTNTKNLIECLKNLKAEGKRVIGYGAAAKGNVLLNFCKITTNLVEYIVDSIPYKQWRFTPGTHIPIYPEQRLEEDLPDYILLLAWNFQEEIMKKQAWFCEKGGKFIVAIPEVKILS